MPETAVLSVTETRTRFSEVYRVLETAIAEGAFPGCAFGLYAQDRVQFADALGRFTYEPTSRQVTPETVYDVASLTKVVATTAAAMLLHQRGRLSLEEPLAEILPGFVVGRPAGDPARHVRLRHLLAHNSGLPAYVEFFRGVSIPEELFRLCLQLPLEAEPGARALYSDPGFMLLGKALEVLACQPLDRFCQREIFAPLGLISTLFRPPAQLRAQIPPTENDATYRHAVIQGEVQDENAHVLGGVAGHAGLFSSVPELLVFAAEILHAASGSGQGRLYTRATLDLFSRPQPPAGSSRALGWDTPSAAGSSAGTLFSARSIGHLGFSGCSLWIDLGARLAAVLLTNRTWPDRKRQAIRAVRPAFHNALREALDHIEK
jgi:CubicO group peptidase (beta-lactamase class C family)